MLPIRIGILTNYYGGSKIVRRLFFIVCVCFYKTFIRVKLGFFVVQFTNVISSSGMTISYVLYQEMY